MARNPDYDVFFDCLGPDRFGDPGIGVLNFDLGISGEYVGVGVGRAELEFDLELSANFIFSQVMSGEAPELDLGIEGYFNITVPRTAWVKWSDIGSFNFEIDKKNLAGERVLDWRGTVYSIRKLGDRVLVYGSGGISILLPSSNTYGMDTISRIGVKSFNSVCGSDKVHLFIDKRNRLCKFTDKVEVLGYSEFMALLTSPVMSYDELNNFAYICDGVKGFVYSIDDSSLGVGPVNITGINYSDGVLYVLSSGVISMPTLEITTDILDATSRLNKTIHEIEVGTNSSQLLEALVEFNMGLASPFVSSGWKIVTPDGIAFVNCFGKEFKVSLRCQTSVNLEIDYLRIKGVIHNYNPADS